MLVNRRTFTVRKGRTAELLELLKDAYERWPPAHAHRVYTPQFGQYDQLVMEGEWESLAEYEARWAEIRASDDWGPFMKKWQKLTRAGGTNEMWTLQIL